MFSLRSHLSLYGQTLAFVVGVTLLTLVGITLFLLSIRAQATKDRALRADRQLLVINGDVQRFLLTRDVAHARHADSALVALMAVLRTEDDWADTDTEDAYAALMRYDTRLTDLKGAIDARGVDESSGAEGAFRARVHEVETLVQTLGLTEVEVHMLSARRSEKDFIMRERSMYVDKVHAAINRVIAASAQQTPSPAQHAAIEAGIRAYGEAFDELVALTFAITEAQADLQRARDAANRELHAVIDGKARRAEQFHTAAVWSVFGTISIALVLGGLLTRSIVQPVQQVQAAAERIARGETNATLDIAAHGELGKLATALNQVRVHVAERKQAEQAASEARQFAETVLAHVQTGVIVYDADLRFRLWNQAVETLTGVASADAMGRTIADVFPTVKTDAYLAYLERAREGEAVQYHDLYILNTANEQVYWLEGTMTPFRAPDGSIKGVVATLNDITERYEQVQALRAAKQDAEVAARAKGEFVAMVSHELRTPLNGILGMASLMGTTTLDEEQQDYLDIIDQCSDHLMALIGQVLDFSHLGSGHFNLTVAPYTPREALNEAIHVIRPEVSAKNLDLSLYLDRTLPTSVLGDRRHVKQVLLNLLSNAVKFTDTGAIAIRLYRTAAGMLCFAVEDTGIGIPEDKYDVVFDPFSQVDASMSRQYEGAGLGLSISQRLAEQMGGRLYFESTAGVGSTFYFEVPLEPTTAALTPMAA